ncbi:MAG: glycosyltransferase family 4 protein [Pseudomonadota bacterium]
MTLAFLIYSYFPYGGQQRDFMRVLREGLQRGHRITVYTMKWQGERPEGVDIVIVPVSAWTRHRLYQRFTAAVTPLLGQLAPDGVIGFIKMPGLDVYYAADPCFAERALQDRGFYYRFTPRYRHFRAYEQAVFGAGSHTHSLLLSPLQREQFARHYPGCEPRLHDVPPGIARDRQAPADADLREKVREDFRQELRHEFGLGEHDLIVLQIGSGFVVKGVDRSLRAIAALPVELRQRVQYFIVGQDKSARFEALAAQLGIASQCRFLGGRDDVPRFLFGSDLLLHPAYSESAGYVLLEATIAGLPVLTTDTCGYAFHITRAGSGEVCQSPFRQEDLNARLLHMLTSEERDSWRRKGVQYGQSEDLYSMPETAVDIIESVLVSRRAAKAGATAGRSA